MSLDKGFEDHIPADCPICAPTGLPAPTCFGEAALGPVTPLLRFCTPEHAGRIPAPHFGWSWRVSVTCPLLLSNVIRLSSLCPSFYQPAWPLRCSKPTSGPLHFLFPGPGVLFAWIATWLLPSAPSGYGPNVRKAFPDLASERAMLALLSFYLDFAIFFITPEIIHICCFFFLITVSCTKMSSPRGQYPLIVDR